MTILKSLLIIGLLVVGAYGQEAATTTTTTVTTTTLAPESTTTPISTTKETTAIDCIVCDSATEAKCASEPADASLKTETCAAGTCYAVQTGTTVKRGCWADTIQCEGASCQKCTVNKCNTQVFATQSIKCIACDSKTNASCAYPPTEGNAVKACENSSCYTHFHKDVVYRGCMLDHSAISDIPDCTVANGCFECKTENCNTNVFQCIRCRSSMDPKCYNDAAELQGSNCATNVTQQKCYHGIWSNVVIRGCLEDADERQQGVCNDDTNFQCQTCTGPNCNTKRSSAGRLDMANGSGLLLVTAALAVAIKKHAFLSF